MEIFNTIYNEEGTFILDNKDKVIEINNLLKITPELSDLKSFKFTKSFQPSKNIRE